MCEYRANKYAAALLMPTDLVCGLHKRGVPVDAMCTVMGGLEAGYEYQAQ